MNSINAASSCRTIPKPYTIGLNATVEARQEQLGHTKIDYTCPLPCRIMRRSRKSGRREGQKFIPEKGCLSIPLDASKQTKDNTTELIALPANQSVYRSTGLVKGLSISSLMGRTDSIGVHMQTFGSPMVR